MHEQRIGKPRLRSFGLIVGAGFAVIGLWPLVFRAEGFRVWAVGLAALLVAAALTLPSALKQPFRLWMAIGGVLAWVNTRILLCVVYYGLFVPLALCFRVVQRDAMRLKLDSGETSYLIPRNKRPASHMRHQY
jgi:hypothetical protein